MRLLKAYEILPVSQVHIKNFWQEFNSWISPKFYAMKNGISSGGKNPEKRQAKSEIENGHKKKFPQPSFCYSFKNAKLFCVIVPVFFLFLLFLRKVDIWWASTAASLAILVKDDLPNWFFSIHFWMQFLSQKNPQNLFIFRKFGTFYEISRKTFIFDPSYLVNIIRILS